MIDEIKQLDQYINNAQRVLFFGGAGVSTESGIPDFRSKDGLYNQHDIRFDKYQPEYLLSHSCLVYEPKVYYEFHRQKMDTRNIEPNNAHKYLAKLEDKGKLIGIVTQNIDGLHQKAGSKKVFEIHGSALRNYCMSCGKEYPEDYIFESHDPIPKCSCGGTVRPDITLYEEGLPEDQVQGAIGGASLSVYPAASFINYFRGNTVVVINESEIGVKAAQNMLVIKRRIGEVFTELARVQGIEL